MSDNTEMVKDLSNEIAAYLEAHKNKSLLTLSKTASVGYSTIRRIAQGEGSPNQETAMAIADAILEDKEKIEFLKKHFPRVGKMLSRAKTIAAGPARQELLLRFMSYEVHSLVFTISATAFGSSTEQIHRVAGDRGLTALDEMVEVGLLERHRDGRVTYPTGGWRMQNAEAILQQVQFSIRNFNPDLLGTDGAAIVRATGSISKSGLQRTNDLVKEFAEELIDIKENPKNEGGIPFFVDLMMNLFDKAQYQEGITQ